MNVDRFALDGFTQLQERYAQSSSVAQEQLGDLVRRTEITYSTRHGINQLEIRAIPLHVHLANSTMANLGRTLSDLDVELRRTASFMLNESTKPLPESRMVEVFSAKHVSSIDVVVVAAMDIYHFLTLRPVDFLLTLDWFWSRRHNRTKVRQPTEYIDRREMWEETLLLAHDCVELGRPVAITMELFEDGSTRFRFESQ